MCFTIRERNEYENLGKAWSFKKMMIKLGMGETNKKTEGVGSLLLFKKTETENYKKHIVEVIYVRKLRCASINTSPHR